MSGDASGSISSSSPASRSHSQRLPPIQTSMSSPSLFLTVRFSTSLPDILLELPDPNRTTVVALKQLIRSRLKQPDSQRRLRFIHGGKILADETLVGAVLKPIPPPPPPSSTPNTFSDPKGKGKAAEAPPQRVYVNCSVGDLLLDAELADERRLAEKLALVPDEQQQPNLNPHQYPYTSSSSAATPPHRRGTGPVLDQGGSSSSNSTSRGPRGFDRLLVSGFSTAEVNQLRLQFRSIQEARHTADTLPSPDTMRTMEDAWLDSDNNAGLATASGGNAAAFGQASDEGAVAGAGGEDFGMAGVLDLLLRGMFIGFVWPLGAVGWLVRGDEEKIPKRMRVFVYFGFVLSLLVGMIRVIG